MALNRAPADSGPYFELAKATAENSRLDFLEFVESNGTIVSSAQWPAKFGYKEPLAAENATAAAFLKEEETPSGSALGLFAIHTVSAGDHGAAMDTRSAADASRGRSPVEKAKDPV